MFQEKNSTSAKLATLASIAALTLPSAKADGAALKSLSLYGQSKSLSADEKFSSSAAVQRTDSTGLSFASSVAIAPDVFITAGHVTPRDNSTTARLNEVVFGENYNTSTERYSVNHTQRYPGFVFGDPTTADLGVGWTNSFMSRITTPISFGGIGLGDLGTQVDYGNIGDPTTGELPSLGDRMAGYAPRITDSINEYPESKYDFFDFNGNASNSLELNVQGLNFSSGAPWYNSNGDLSGLLIAKTNGISIGESIVLNLNTPEIQAYLQPIIDDSWNRYYASIPEPSSTGLLVAAGAAALARRRRRI